MKYEDKNQEWFNNLVKNAFNLNSEENSDLIEKQEEMIKGSHKIDNLQVKKRKQKLYEIQKNVFKDISNELMEENTEVVPTSDDPSKEVNQAAIELNDWIQDNPSIEEELKNKIRKQIDELLD